jgi:NADPH:quinone reductase-like Zn-dependent oxidoreductase
MSSTPTSGLQLRSTVSESGTLELTLVEMPVPVPGENDVVIRVEASPVNPSDLGLLLAGADVSKAQTSERDGFPVVSAPIDPTFLRSLSARLGESMAVGNEGAGTVVAAGSSPAAQALIGKTVSAAGGQMYSQYRKVDVSLCLELPEGTPAKAGASSFVNPMTALGMVETMRMEGHKALVHTAAASNLGQMLVKLCIEEQVPLVNIVRSQKQVAILRSIGAKYVCDSSSPTFMNDLIDALTETSATLAFDATGGGSLGSQILTGIEIAANKNATEYSRYGSTTYKQLYIYGGLDRSETVLTRSFGFAWGVGGWLLTPFLGKIGLEGLIRLRQRVADGITTTFASHYTQEISLRDALKPEIMQQYARQATGEKFLINPQA